MKTRFIKDNAGRVIGRMFEDDFGDAFCIRNVEYKNRPGCVFYPHPTRPPISKRPNQRYIDLLNASINLRINPPFEPRRRLVTYPNKLGYL